MERSLVVQMITIYKVDTQPSPSRSEASARKNVDVGPRCDVTAKGASEHLADFSTFNMAGNLYIQINL
jgi:hypothetical protein